MFDELVTKSDIDAAIDNADLDGENGWATLWYEWDDEPFQTDLGPAYVVARWGGGGDQAQQWIVVSLADKLWQKEGRHNSWDSDYWDGPLNEVEAFEKTVTRYKVVK